MRTRRKAGFIEVVVDGKQVGTLRLRHKTWQLRYRQNGQRIERTLHGVHDSAEALRQAEVEIARGALAEVPTIAPAPRPGTISTLDEALAEYDEKHLDKKCRPSSKRRSYELIRDFIRSVGEDKPLGILDRHLVRAWLDERAKHVAPVTVNNDLGRIRAFARWCSREGYLKAAPDLTGLKLPVDGKAARGLSVAEVAKVREKVEGEAFLSDWFELAINVGLRPGELAHLRPVDYDEKKRVLHVRPWGDWKLKTRKSRRSLPVNAAAHEVLARRKEMAEADAGRRKLAGEDEREVLLFPSSTGTVFDLDNLRHDFEACLPDGFYFTLYCLRHTFAYRCVAAGWGVERLSLYLGHTDVKTTQGYYEGIELESLGAPPELELKKAQA